MLKPDLAKWKQTLNDLFELALNAEHSRTRERFLALYHLAAERRPMPLEPTVIASRSWNGCANTMRSGLKRFITSAAAAPFPFFKREHWPGR